MQCSVSVLAPRQTRIKSASNHERSLRSFDLRCRTRCASRFSCSYRCWPGRVDGIVSTLGEEGKRGVAGFPESWDVHLVLHAQSRPQLEMSRQHMRIAVRILWSIQIFYFCCCDCISRTQLSEPLAADLAKSPSSRALDRATGVNGGAGRH